jgi:uncharacterized membrane protein YeaQ/YmgE (transglycosylase-associated protein family)
MFDTCVIRTIAALVPSDGRFGNIHEDMGIIAFLVLGGIAGWVASLIMGTDASQGVVMNIVVGVIGALIGGLLFNAFGNAGVTGFNLYSLIVATLGAIIGLYVVRLVRAA